MNGYEPLHDAWDTPRLNSILESMKENGWIGAPLVAWGSHLVTGSHRYEAARLLEIDVPVVQLDDVFAEAGLSLDEIHESCGSPTIGDWSGVVEMFDHLPAEIKAKYGIQIE